MNEIIQQDLKGIAAARLPWQNFSGTTILVTGANGFLPAYMVETLLDLNRYMLDKPCKVVALARNYQRARVRFLNYASDSNLDLMIQDVSQPITLPYKFDFIIHAASQASPVFYKIDPVGTLSSNSTGTRNLLELARGGCKGFLFFSSGDVYGDVSHILRPVCETDFGASDPLNPRSCYGESKRMGETLCSAFTSQYDIPTKIVRISHTYGPGMRLDDGRIFADFTRDILHGGPLVLRSDGTAQRPFLYLSDATVAFFTVLLKGEPAQAYNVANPATIVSIGELADRLATLFSLTVKRSHSQSAAYMPATIPGVVPSIEKIKSLGWEPTTGIEEGFQRTVESYR